MRTTTTLAASGIVALLLIGCGPPPSPTANKPAIAEPELTGPPTEGVEYANWKQFKVGTTVVRKRVAKNSVGTVTEIRTLKLTELTAVRAVVESQTTVERPGEPAKVNPATRLDFHAQFNLPAGMKEEDFRKPARSAKKTGTERLKYFGQEYDATIFEWQDTNEGGKVNLRLWQCEAFPGRFIKQTMSSIVEGKAIETFEEVTEVKQPE